MPLHQKWFGQNNSDRWWPAAAAYPFQVKSNASSIPSRFLSFRPTCFLFQLSCLSCSLLSRHSHSPDWKLSLARQHYYQLYQNLGWHQHSTSREENSKGFSSLALFGPIHLPLDLIPSAEPNLIFGGWCNASFAGPCTLVFVSLLNMYVVILILLVNSVLHVIWSTAMQNLLLLVNTCIVRQVQRYMCVCFILFQYWARHWLQAMLLAS